MTSPSRSKDKYLGYTSQINVYNVRSTEHILFRAISLVGKIFGTFLVCSSLRTANPFRIERSIKREFWIRIKEYKFQQNYYYFGKTFKEQAREVHVRLNLGLCWWPYFFYFFFWKRGWGVDDVVEDSSRKAKLVVSLYVVGFCFMYNIHDVHLSISILFFR